MNLEEQIYTRKSCRKYIDDEIDMAPIHEFISSVRALNGDIDFAYKILNADGMNIRTRWTAPYYLALYSERKDNYLENLGFVFQQVSLFLQSEGIGSCWVGMASPKKKDRNFVIAIAFGKSDDMTREADGFKRKKLCEISDSLDEKLRPARLAPSAINSQPWYFRHFNDEINVFQVRQNVFKRRLLKNWNHIDMGIALANLYVANTDSFEFYIKNDVEVMDGYTYTGTIKI